MPQAGEQDVKDDGIHIIALTIHFNVSHFLECSVLQRLQQLMVGRCSIQLVAIAIGKNELLFCFPEMAKREHDCSNREH